MQEPSSEVRPGSPLPSPNSRDSEGIFALRKKFPGEAELPPSATPPSVPRSKVFTRLVLPLVLLIIVIGGIAYVVQNLRRPKGDGPVQPPGDPTADLITYTSHSGKSAPANPNDKEKNQVSALWDPKHPGFAAEVERGTSGRYHFRLENKSGATAELGLEWPSCDCAGVDIAFLTAAQLAAIEGDRDHEAFEQVLPNDLSWQSLERDKKHKMG